MMTVLIAVVVVMIWWWCGHMYDIVYVCQGAVLVLATRCMMLSHRIIGHMG